MESKGDGYLWYIAAQGKRYPTARPLTATVWHALEYCHAQKLRHVFFLNVGLPFRRNPYPGIGFRWQATSTYRWFHFTIDGSTVILSWFYKE